MGIRMVCLVRYDGIANNMMIGVRTNPESVHPWINQYFMGLDRSLFLDPHGLYGAQWKSPFAHLQLGLYLALGWTNRGYGSCAGDERPESISSFKDYEPPQALRQEPLLWREHAFLLHYIQPVDESLGFCLSPGGNKHWFDWFLFWKKDTLSNYHNWGIHHVFGETQIKWITNQDLENKHIMLVLCYF